jgi:chromosome segregation ATPase
MMAAKSLPERVATLEDHVSTLQNLPRELADFRHDVGHRFDRVDERLETIDHRFDGIDDRLQKVDRRFGVVDDRLDSLEQAMRDGYDRLSSQMRILHEDLIERIKTLGEASRPGGSGQPRAARTRKR